MKNCYICEQSPVDVILDLGLQPISNRFLTKPSADEYKHPLRLGHCKKCGLAQLVDPVPSAKVKPQVDWIRYNEPEGHLDDVVDMLIQLPGITTDTIFLGITDKDDSTVKRLNQKGFAMTSRLDPQRDLRINDKNAGIETIQHCLTEEMSKKIIKEKGQADIIFARHIIEHAHQIKSFIQALKMLIKDQGYIVFETPDHTPLFNTYNYSILWEEHIVYFTPATFLHALNQAGFQVIFYKNYPYSMENVMVTVVNVSTQQKESPLSKIVLEEEINRNERYSEMFPEQKAKIKNILKKYREKGSIAMIGAGHLAAHFINLMDLKEDIQFIVDDHPNKKNLFMPGSQLPIFSTSALSEQKIKYCLMSVSQESEMKIIANKKEFIEAGGQFYSIFPTSQYALKAI